MNTSQIMVECLYEAVDFLLVLVMVANKCLVTNLICHCTTLLGQRPIEIQFSIWLRSVPATASSIWTYARDVKRYCSRA